MALFGSIGRDPISLRLAVVNNELKCNNLKNCENLTHYPSFSMLSCRYLYHLKNSTISQVNYTPLHNKMFRFIIFFSFLIKRFILKISKTQPKQQEMERFGGLFNLVVIFLKTSLIESLVVLTTPIWKPLLLVKLESTSTNLV